MRRRCSSLPSTARSRCSESAFTCAGSFTDARLIITLRAAPRSAVSAMSAPTPISLAGIEQPARRLGDLQRHARCREEGRLHALLARFLFLVGLARELHRLGDA